MIIIIIIATTITNNVVIYGYHEKYFYAHYDVCIVDDYFTD